MTAVVGPDLELQGAIKTALAASTDLASAMGGTLRLYQDVPEDVTFPYITLGEGQLVPDLAECIDGSEVFPVLHVWSRSHGGFEEAKKIAANIFVALTAAPITLTENKCLLLERDQLGEITLRDPDGKTKHIACHYRAMIETR
jgi:hypothetical protein